MEKDPSRYIDYAQDMFDAMKVGEKKSELQRAIAPVQAKIKENLDKLPEVENKFRDRYFMDFSDTQPDGSEVEIPVDEGLDELNTLADFIIKNASTQRITTIARNLSDNFDWTPDAPRQEAGETPEEFELRKQFVADQIANLKRYNRKRLAILNKFKAETVKRGTYPDLVSVLQHPQKFFKGISVGEGK